ncbi:MAG TPA: glycosyltransferase [Ignavibacteriaceae bacterium]|nr:glycosyltransferase [Ignavibacteriaceae bacterium]
MISIVTITYNNYDQLIKTLNSIPKSDIVESIVINGGDCKKTKEFLENYSGKSITEKDEGIADAFNKGIKMASGDYIMFLNSGDILLSADYLNKANSILDNNSDIAFVHSNIIFSDQLGSDLFMRPQMKNVGRGMPYHHQTLIVRKKVFDEIGLFNKKLKYAMDFDLVVRMEKKNLIGHYINEEAVVKMDGSGISVSKEIDSIKECYTILKSEEYFNFKNMVGYSVRYSFYIIRKLIGNFGGKSILKKLKQVKHNN